MVNVLSLFLLLFSLSAHAIVAPSGVPQIGLGGSNLNGPWVITSGTNAEGWFTLHAGGSVTANQFRAFVKDGGSSQYQVPSGGITCFHVTYNAASAGIRMQLASSTAADGVTAASLSAGQKYETGAAAAFGHVTLAAQTNYDEGIVYAFSASAYPYIGSDSTAVWGVTLTCKAN
jgi:hypothetical protein